MADNPNWTAPAASQLIIWNRQWRKQCENFDWTLRAWKCGQINVLVDKRYKEQPRCLYEVGREVSEKVFANRIGEIRGICNLTGCNMNQFADCLEILLKVEELYQAIRMRKHDTQRELVPIWDENGDLIRLGFEMPNLACKSPPIVKGDYVVIDYGQGRPLAVQVINSGENYIELPKQAYELYGLRYLRGPANVAFVSQGKQFKIQQAAVERLRASGTVKRLVFEEIGQPNLDEVKIDVAQTSTRELDERLQALNCRQREAVIGMLEARCRPKPYILLALTGTGVKTTLVEAVVQVHKRTRKQAAEVDSLRNEDQRARGNVSDLLNLKVRILACSSSTDAISWWHRNIKAQLPDARVSLLSAGRNLDESDQSEIVCASHAKSSSLFGVHTFDYIFVDEANQASVAESLILASLLKPDGCLVLAGNPHKLRPEVGCKQASELGLGQSLLERLLEFEIYRLKSLSLGYDSRLITMLRLCYYGDIRIMSICDGSTLPIKETPRDLLAKPSLTGPLQFRHVAGEEVADLEQDSTSNQAEIDVCVDLFMRLYSMGIMSDSSGITSAYKLQVDKIRRELDSFNASIKTTLCDCLNQ